MWDNIIIFWKESGNKLRTVVVTMVLSVVVIAAYFTGVLVTRTPNLISCAWEASYRQKIPYEKWEFLWLESTLYKQCKYDLNGRLTPLFKEPTDVGMRQDDFTDM